MPFKSNSTFDSLLAMTALCNDAELRALADKCQSLIADRERIKRNELRQELIENLQNAINNILVNGFTLTIENDERNSRDIYQGVIIDPNEKYSLLLEDEE